MVWSDISLPVWGCDRSCQGLHPFSVDRASMDEPPPLVSHPSCHLPDDRDHHITTYMYVSYFFVYQITIFLTLPESLNDLILWGDPGSYKNDYYIYYSIQPRKLCFLNPPAHLMLQGCDRQATPEGNGNPPSHHRLANCHPPTHILNSPPVYVATSYRPRYFSLQGWKWANPSQQGTCLYAGHLVSQLKP